ncbi:response regulator [Patescibacteria group bacterium]|nr:response regulator [Patescibacteria group bacterium]MBU4511861.1 response regulator [Patescibacteria group bacterium]MCG2693256.1 response regulator [Candidatus Parcubacteria bacterium]
MPVIVLNNLGPDKDIQKAKDMGAVDCLVKANFTSDEILEKITSALRK